MPVRENTKFVVLLTVRPQSAHPVTQGTGSRGRHPLQGGLSQYIDVSRICVWAHVAGWHVMRTQWRHPKRVGGRKQRLEGVLRVVGWSQVVPGYSQKYAYRMRTIKCIASMRVLEVIKVMKDARRVRARLKGWGVEPANKQVLSRYVSVACGTRSFPVWW